MVKLKTASIIVLAIFFLVIISSCQELEQFSSTIDSDGDGWPDTQEKIAGTNPQKVDSDDDGYWDPRDPNPLDPNIPVSGEISKPPAQPGEEQTPQPTKESKLQDLPASPDTSATGAISEDAAATEEYHKVQDAVTMMMRNNKLTQLENPASVPTSNMHFFPDTSTRHGKTGTGYVLYLHDFDGDGKPDTNYISLRTTKGTYICDKYGNVTQVTTGYE